MKSFDDAYLGSCLDCDETLEWEWESDILAFKATCGCLKQHKLVPLTAELEIVDEDDDDEANDDNEEDY